MSEFLLQDSRALTGDRLMFWAQAGSYTSNLDAAQRFTLEEATKQNECRETDLPWPVPYLMERHTLAVDHQYVKPDEVAAELATAEHTCLFVAGAWNGNDLIWLTFDGRHSDNLAEAEVYPGSVGVSVGSYARQGVRAIPKAMADALARKVVASGRVDIKAALKGTGIKLAKPQRPKKGRYRCEPCGVFISERQRFGDCPRCGGANAP
jgi:hypothetical protein